MVNGKSLAYLLYKQIRKAQETSQKGLYEAMSICMDRPLDKLLDMIRTKERRPGAITTR
jgi:hypothetical protein